MFKNLNIISFVLFSLLFCSCSVIKNKNKISNEVHVEMQTSKGSIIFKLYNQTPLHRDNFIKLVEENFYDGVTFHRIIKDFMAQAGDPNSKDESFKGQLGQNSKGETIPAEFSNNLFHKKGALAAARMGDNVNPEKKSSGSQFYIVQGKKHSLKQLSQMENRINQNQENIFSFSDSAKKLYQEIGGTPFLDNGYTVFGEVIKGIEIIDKICSVETSNGNKPINNVTILSARIIN